MKQLRWGMIGGGSGSQIGPAHRLGALLDGEFVFAAGALDHRPAHARKEGIRLGLDRDRAYESWQSMLAEESARKDRVDLVTVATPNKTHYEIAGAFVEAGFSVLCEKPMTMTVKEAEGIVRLTRKSGAVFAVNYVYSAYALVRQMRAMVMSKALGRIRLVVAEFSHGHHAAGDDESNPRVRWRYDPEFAGVSGQFADCGIHALHLVSFVTGQEIEWLSADTVSTVKGRKLEDDALVAFRMTDGTVGRLWTSSVAIGRQHGLTLEVYGEKGGLRWEQEHPNQLFYMPLGKPMQIFERGQSNLDSDARRASHLAIGHAEGLPMAFANMYRDLAEAIRARRKGKQNSRTGALLPTAEDGLRSVAAIHAVATSGAANGKWTDAVPKMLR